MMKLTNFRCDSTDTSATKLELGRPASVAVRVCAARYLSPKLNQTITGYFHPNLFVDNIGQLFQIRVGTVVVFQILVANFVLGVATESNADSVIAALMN